MVDYLREKAVYKMLMGSIPAGIIALYQKQGIIVSLYARIRWRLCPFEKIESQLPREGTIVDVGCGFGMFANYLKVKSNNRVVLGFDKSSRRIEAAKASIRPGGNIEFFNEEADLKKFSNLSGVVMTDFLHHVNYEYQERLLRDTFSALAEGGRLVILDLDTKPRWKYLMVKAIDRVLNPRQEICYRSEENFMQLLRGIGFMVRSYPAHYNLPLSDILFLCDKPADHQSLEEII